MKYLKLCLIASVFITQLNNPLKAQEYYMLVGTYDSPTSEGIYVYKFNSNNGTGTKVSHIKSSNPSFLCVSPNQKNVYAVFENSKDGKGGDIAAYTFDAQNGQLQFINKQPSGGDHPCYVAIDQTGKWVFAGNYTSGSLSVAAVNKDGSLSPASSILQHSGSSINTQRQKSPHVHCTYVSPDNNKLFVPDLGIDKIMIYSFDASTGSIKAGKQPFVSVTAGSGPRHFTFHPNKKFAYLIEELSGSIITYRYKNGRLHQKQKISSLPVGDTSIAGSADIHITNDGNFLYCSNRGESNTIGIFKVNKKKGTVSLLGHQSTFGKTPRNFSIDPSGNYLLVANQNSNDIIIFKRDSKTGLLSDTGNKIVVGKPVCIKWIIPE